MPRQRTLDPRLCSHPAQPQVSAGMGTKTSPQHQFNLGFVFSLSSATVRGPPVSSQLCGPRDTSAGLIPTSGKLSQRGNLTGRIPNPPYPGFSEEHGDPQEEPHRHLKIGPGCRGASLNPGGGTLSSWMPPWGDVECAPSTEMGSCPEKGVADGL
uniref:uncharacterized protein LOC120892861 isoform X1 n=1 Tax=Ictidomys tridecemlineatus TaxID=43179 RepID=UPI001A9F9995|nr:uncharacterized protein LOC120892861 isoform X1 [Ictidomys tridecemlineatus]